MATVQAAMLRQQQQQQVFGKDQKRPIRIYVLYIYIYVSIYSKHI